MYYSFLTLMKVNGDHQLLFFYPFSLIYIKTAFRYSCTFRRQVSPLHLSYDKDEDISSCVVHGFIRVIPVDFRR